MKSKTFFQTICIVAISMLFVISCNRDDHISLTKEEIQEIETYNPQLLIENFAAALAKVFSENKEIRELVKDEALKMIDDDYDVLYILVKDVKLRDNSTLESNLSKYLPREKLSQLIQEIPTLTIFVPELIDDVFSAVKWDTDLDIPKVAFIDKENNVHYIDSFGDKKTFAHNEIPLFPIVVLKKSERIVLKSSKLRSSIQDNVTVIRANNGLEFVFDDEIYDNIKPKQILTRLGANTDIPSNMNKMFDAKRFKDQVNIWQRDYIYYDINSVTGRGSFNENFGEHIYSFQLLGDPNGAYNGISDQTGDPRYNSSFVTGPRGSTPIWTDGEFEFWVNVKLASKTAVGDGIRKKFKAKGEQLFDLDIYYPPRGSGTAFVRGVSKTKKFFLPQPMYLFSWDLEKFSETVKITIEEQDDPETITNSEKTTSTFATNFEFNASIGEKEKVGAKFGATSTESKEVFYSVVTTKNADPLGDVYIAFGHDVIISEQLVDNNLITPTGETQRPPTHYPNYQPAFNPSYISGDSYKIEVATLQLY